MGEKGKNFSSATHSVAAQGIQHVPEVRSIFAHGLVETGGRLQPCAQEVISQQPHAVSKQTKPSSSPGPWLMFYCISQIPSMGQINEAAQLPPQTSVCLLLGTVGLKIIFYLENSFRCFCPCYRCCFSAFLLPLH